MLGFGAHLDARIALLRAVTEMNQMLSNLPGADASISGKHVTDPDTLTWLKTATRVNQPYLMPLPERVGPIALNGRFADAHDLASDVRACQALVERQGLEMLVLDQTRPEIGLPVAKVIVPGMRHFRARFAPGRLYDVPARLGWLSRPQTEEEWTTGRIPRTPTRRSVAGSFTTCSSTPAAVAGEPMLLLAPRSGLPARASRRLP